MCAGVNTNRRGLKNEFVSRVAKIIRKAMKQPYFFQFLFEGPIK